jgi:hypothetical protein
MHTPPKSRDPRIKPPEACEAYPLDNESSHWLKSKGGPSEKNRSRAEGEAGVALVSA